MARLRAFRRGRFESLEQRQLLAGDISVSVVGGLLTMEGDAESNKVMIAAGAEAGSFVVTGLDGTNLIQDGQPPATEVTVSGVRNTRIGLGGGDDLVAVVSGNLRGSLRIGTGEGADRVLIGTVADASELAGVVPGEVNVGGSLHIGTDGGADQVAVDAARIQGHLGIHTGAESDVVSLGSALETDATARVRVGGGVHVGLGEGNDELSLSQLRARGIVVGGGGGDDTINALQVRSHSMALGTAGGLDTVALTQVNVRHLGVHTGDGGDNLDIRDSAFASLGVALGDGEDVLTTSALKARIAIQLGGEGEDTLDDLGGNDFGHELIRGFEIPPDVNVNGVATAGRPIARLVGRLR